MAKHFGKDHLVVGNTYILRDVVAQSKHRSPEHVLCKVRSVEISPRDGVIRVGVAFYGSNGGSQPDVDAQGFAIEPSCFCFPHTLRAAV